MLKGCCQWLQTVEHPNKTMLQAISNCSNKSKSYSNRNKGEGEWNVNGNGSVNIKQRKNEQIKARAN